MKRRTPACFASSAKTHRRLVIDLVGQLRIEITERIVGESREMHDGIDPLQVSQLRVPHVLPISGTSTIPLPNVHLRYKSLSYPTTS